MGGNQQYGKRARGAYRFLIVCCTLVLIIAVAAFYFYPGGREEQIAVPGQGTGSPGSEASADPYAIEDGLHLRTGLIAKKGYREVIDNCTGCHSASLVTQNRMDAKGWEATIKWMQETQNLWDLGDKQEVIINYLVDNYPVEKKGRREPLVNIEWYSLKADK
jgi:hypothetical protein